MDESIYNIVPKEFVPPPKQPIYRSKYPPQIPPTGSTFGNHTTSKPHVPFFSLREPTFLVNLPADSRPIPNSARPKHSATSKETGSPNLNPI